VSYTINDASLAGFAVLLPFNFDGNSDYGLLPHRALVCCHLARNSGKAALFERPVADRLINKHDHTIKTVQSATVLDLHDFIPRFYVPCHTIGYGESIVLLQGEQSTQTSIAIGTLPQQQFPDCGYIAKDNSMFAWNNDLAFGTGKLRACFVEAALDLSDNRLIAFAAAGPVGQTSLFDWLIDKGSWMTDLNGQIVPDYSKGGLASLVFNDLKRQTSWTMFGTDEFGCSQVIGASGVAMLCQGSFARAGVLDWLKSMSHAAMNQLPDAILEHAQWLLKETSLHEAMSKDTHLNIETQTLFEGISVWNLQARRDINAGQEDPAEPIML